jgi:hypothetical protein
VSAVWPPASDQVDLVAFLFPHMPQEGHVMYYLNDIVIVSVPGSKSFEARYLASAMEPDGTEYHLVEDQQGTQHEVFGRYLSRKR